MCSATPERVDSCDAGAVFNGENDDPAADVPVPRHHGGTL